jgi:hypothetical protein
LKYADRPYPLASVNAKPEGDDLVVTRSIEYGPMRGDGSVEVWARASTGEWRRASVKSKFSY